MSNTVTEDSFTAKAVAQWVMVGPQLERIEVANGWLYRTTHVGAQMVFVPDMSIYEAIAFGVLKAAKEL